MEIWKYGKSERLLFFCFCCSSSSFYEVDSISFLCFDFFPKFFILFSFICSYYYCYYYYC